MVSQAFEGPWCIVGDFNAILANSLKRGGRPFASSSNDGFRLMVNTNGLIDFGVCWKSLNISVEELPTSRSD